MTSSSGGIDKPYDRFLKSIAEEAPRMLLHLLGVVPLEAEIALTPLPRETSPPVKVTDYAAVLAMAPASPFVFHSEFVVWYRGLVPSEMARYAVSLVLQHRYPVESVLVLLRPEGAPRSIPEEGVYELGKTKVTHAFRTVRFWELDPEPILRAKDPRLLPWAVIMKTSDAQVRQIARYLVSHGDEELLGRFLAIGPLRYDKKELEEMTGGTSMGIVEAILEGSSVVREVCERAAEKGKEEGLEQGLEQGREGATRDLLRSAVGVRFPGLETLPELGAMPAANLHAFFEEVLRSTNREQIEAMIRAATAATPGTPSSTPHPDKA